MTTIHLHIAFLATAQREAFTRKQRIVLIKIEINSQYVTPPSEMACF